MSSPTALPASGHPLRLHGTCVDLGGVAVLLRGPPGAGKSDLALRLIDGGAHLVADDQVELQLERGRLVPRAPAAILGLIEARGIGLLPVPARSGATLGLVVDLATDDIERMPEPSVVELLGVRVPVVRLNPFEASAVAKLRLSAGAIARGELPAA